jgi:hypothetical protein
MPFFVPDHLGHDCIAQLLEQRRRYAGRINLLVQSQFELPADLCDDGIRRATVSRRSFLREGRKDAGGGYEKDGEDASHKRVRGSLSLPRRSVVSLTFVMMQ